MKKRIILVLGLAILLPLAIWWLSRLSRQYDMLIRAEQNVTRAMNFIGSGAMKQANPFLTNLAATIDSLSQEWAALPGIRTRERTLSQHIDNLNVAWQYRLKIIEQTTSKTIDLLALGQYAKAATHLEDALRECDEDQSLKALSLVVQRLRVQDFKRAADAAQQCASVLNEHIPLSDSVQRALPGLAAAVECEKAANHAAHQRIAAQVRHLINGRSSRESATFKPVLKGKTMIWDATKNDVETAYELLPDNLRASSQDGKVTIFSVIRRDQIIQGYYSISNQPAYKEKMTIGVIYWPQRQNAGTAIVWGGDPPASRIVSILPGYGSSVSIKDWVASLPRE